MEILRLVRKQWGLPALLVVMLLWVMEPVRFYADQADSLTMDLTQMETFYNFLGGHKFCTYVFVDDIREGDDRIEVEFRNSEIILCEQSTWNFRHWTFHFEDPFTADQASSIDGIIEITGYFPDYSDVDHLDFQNAEFFHCELTDVSLEGDLEAFHNIYLEDLLYGYIDYGNVLFHIGEKENTISASHDRFLQATKKTEEMISEIIENQKKGADEARNRAMEEYASKCSYLTEDDVNLYPSDLEGRDFVVTGCVAIRELEEPLEGMELTYGDTLEDTLEDQLENKTLLLYDHFDIDSNGIPKQPYVRLAGTEEAAWGSRSFREIAYIHNNMTHLRLFDALEEADRITVYGKCLWTEEMEVEGRVTTVPVIYPVFLIV